MKSTALLVAGFILLCCLSVEHGLIRFAPYYLIKSEIIQKRRDFRGSIFKKSTIYELKPGTAKIPEQPQKTYFTDRYDHFLRQCSKYEKSQGFHKNLPNNALKLSKSYPSTRINYDYLHKILFCFPPKSATTSWNKLMAAVFHNMTISSVVDKFGSDYVYEALPSLHKLNHMQNLKFSTKNISPETKKLLSEFSQILAQDDTKINHGLLLTRHPLTRLYSSWGHRLSDIQTDHRVVFRQQIIKMNKFYKRDEDYPAPTGIFVTFSSFLRFVLSDEAHTDGLGNIHWYRIEDLCQPCQLKQFYTLQVKTETSNLDASEFLDLLSDESSSAPNYTKIVGKFPSAYSQENLNDTDYNSKGEVLQTKNVEKRMEGIQKYYREHVDKDLVYAIYEKYYWDFELFGYDLEGFV